jgi:hypothetical protein
MSKENLGVDREAVTAGELQISSETMTDIIENIAFSTSYLSDPEKLSTNTSPSRMARPAMPLG